ncbi:MAG: HAMP domain-containing protein [Desulfobacterales bacterium]|nr:HAMP domain-containing protein [Desulfobacterales bacterium]
MKIKLSYKLFIAFLSTSLFILFLPMAIENYARRNFMEYVNRTELDRLADLENALKEMYLSNHGWNPLQSNPSLWYQLLRIYKKEPPHPPPPPHDPDNKMHPDQFQPEHPPFPHPFEMIQRLGLFDNQQNNIAGSSFPIKEFTIKSIENNGQIIGWLGIHKLQPFKDRRGKDFLQRQHLFMLVSVSVSLLITILVTVFISRNIVIQVKALKEGTSDLISRQFKKRIPVYSSDELGDLSQNFNTLALTLEQYETLRKQWITDISHELRTPITVLRCEIEAIQDGIRTPSMDTIASLHSEIIRLAKLVDDLHLLSMADSNNLIIRKTSIYPLEILLETVQMVKHRMEQRGLCVNFECDDIMGIYIQGEPFRLNQIFSNILENNLRYSASPGTIHIVAHRFEKFIQIDIEDTGPGVPNESFERIFDRLYRVDPSRSRELGGSGLGLSISKQLVELHDGQISAKSSALGGLLIQITFPTDFQIINCTRLEGGDNTC